ncbi:DUF2946 domain-containing protein [uncultured Oxalicibacterium sp.]|uniref:DUF2946 domain-containing protein n=1 Tax=uncultured Oxalicibacterium sp. TaxID=1168540 RepID=UPI0025DE9505|nr:DUF2946 domain-containing protein [uncultured Oxalicibacterium sp.]
MTHRRVSLLTVWMALFAILLGTLAPTVSHALANDKVLGVMLEICASDGMRMIDVSKQKADEEHGDSSGTDHLLHMEDCPFCRVSSHTVSLLPTSWQFFPLVTATAHYPPLFYRAHRPLFAWASARSRAPPTFS